MYVRKKKNPSGVVSVQIIDKSSGRYRLIKTVGSSSSSEDIERLYREGLLFIDHYGGQTSLQEIFDENIETASVEQVIDNISNILINSLPANWQQLNI